MAQLAALLGQRRPSVRFPRRLAPSGHRHARQRTHMPMRGRRALLSGIDAAVTVRVRHAAACDSG
jgi:hypothetical protein